MNASYGGLNHLFRILRLKDIFQPLSFWRDKVAFWGIVPGSGPEIFTHIEPVSLLLGQEIRKLLPELQPFPLPFFPKFCPLIEDIFTEIMANEAMELERLMYHAVKDEKSVRKQLEMIFIGSIEYMEQHPFLDSTLRRDVEMVTPRLLKHIFSIEDRYVSVIEDYVRRGIEKGEIEPHNPRLIAYVLYKIFEAFTYGSRLGEEGFDKEDVEELIPLLINKGLAPAKPKAARSKKS